MKKSDIKYQLLRITVPDAEAESVLRIETDKRYERITGILYSAGNLNAVKDTVFTKFEVNTEEIYPDGFEVKMLLSDSSVSPDERFYSLDESAGGSTLEIRHKDGGNAGGYPYSSIIYLRLENKTDEAKK